MVLVKNVKFLFFVVAFSGLIYLDTQGYGIDTALYIIISVVYLFDKFDLDVIMSVLRNNDVQRIIDRLDGKDDEIIDIVHAILDAYYEDSTVLVATTENIGEVEIELEDKLQPRG